MAEQNLMMEARAGEVATGGVGGLVIASTLDTVATHRDFGVRD